MRRTSAVLATLILGLSSAAAPAMADELAPEIPDAVMMQAEDFEGVTPGPVEATLTWPLLPQPCADVPLPQPTAIRSLAADFHARYRVYEQVSRFARDGAHTYLDGLKAQLTACEPGDETGFQLVAVDHKGPDTALFVGRYDEGNRWVAYVAAAVGHYVVVVMTYDPVIGAADVTLTNGLASAAMARAGEKAPVAVVG